MGTVGAAIALMVAAAEAIAAPAIAVMAVVDTSRLRVAADMPRLSMVVAVVDMPRLRMAVVDMPVAHRMAAVVDTTAVAVDTGNL
jgi:hypothetical protein